MSTPTPLAAALVAAVLAATVAAQQQEPNKHPLRVAYVGQPGTPRADAFAAFLREHFDAVDVCKRGDDPAPLQDHDVVLLDWPQGDDARAERQAGGSPLGKREDWHTPTVLLGSAGLNLAGAWSVRGGFG